MRSHLYVPADRPEVLARAESRGADCIIIDLEDSVAESRKTAALGEAIEFLRSARTVGERWVRVNHDEAGLGEIRELVGAGGLDGIWLPKVEPGPWIDRALALLAESDTRVGLLIESAAGLVGMPQLPALRPDTLVQLGEVDLAANLRMRDTSDESMVPYRARIVMECVIRGLEAPVAPVHTRFDDPDRLRASTTSLRDRGFGSRACIHPAQVTVVNEVFAVDPLEVARARAILDEFDARAAEGTGAYRGEDGAMVDLATVRWARTITNQQGAQ